MQIVGAQTRGVGVRVKCVCEIQYQQLIEALRTRVA